MAKSNKQQYDDSKSRAQAIKDNDFLNNQADLLNRKLDDQINKAGELNKLRSNLLKGMVDEVDNLETQKTLLKEYDDNLKELVDRRTKHGKNLLDERDTLEDVIKTEEKRRDLQEELTGKANGMLDGLEGQIKNIPLVGNLLASTMDFGGLKEQMGGIMKGITQQFVSLTAAGVPAGKAIGMSFRGAIKPIMSFGASLWAALAPLLPIILPIIAALAILKKAFEVDQQVADLSREMGIANSEAREMVTNFNEMSMSSGNLNMTTKNLIEAQKQLASSMGMTAQYSDAMLQDQIQLTKYMGMSGEEAANFQKMSAQSGMSVRDMQTEVASAVGGFNELTGASVDFAGVLKDISNLSLEMRSRFNGNVKEMAMAVTQAKALGTTLQESSDAAQNLLNMESSLQAEMKARVLTGVNINNNEIRQAQLRGEQGEVLRLQAKQMSKIGDISNKLPHEQKAIAEAMGMSVDQMLKMNEQQMVMDKLGVKKLDNLTKEQLMSAGLSDEKAKQMILDREKQSQQEKLSASMDKMNAALAEAGAIILPVVGYLVDLILPSITKAFKMVGAIFKFLRGLMKLFTDPIEGIKMMGQAIYDFVIAPFEAIGNTISALFGGGGESTGYDEGASDSINDGVITPDGEVIKTNPADFIMATTNPAAMAGKMAGASSGNIDYDKLAAAIGNQPLQIVVDGRVISEITKKQNQNKSFNKQLG